MDLRVAVLATATDKPFVGRRSGCELASRQQIVRMPDHRMTLLAQQRPRRHQQHFMIGAMGLMAIEAAFRDWRVLKQEGPALFGVAAKARFVKRGCSDHGLGNAAVRIMAIGA